MSNKSPINFQANIQSNEIDWDLLHKAGISVEELKDHCHSYPATEWLGDLARYACAMARRAQGNFEIPDRREETNALKQRLEVAQNLIDASKVQITNLHAKIKSDREARVQELAVYKLSHRLVIAQVECLNKVLGLTDPVRAVAEDLDEDEE